LQILFFLSCGASLWILCVSGCWARNKFHSNEVNVKRERLTQIVLVIVGLLNLALIYFLYMDLRHSSWLLERKNEVEPMFLSFFIPVGVFLLVAARRPSEHRSMIALAAWWNISHGAVMAIQTVEAWIHSVHRNFTDVIVFLVIGAVLLVLLPAKREAVAPGVA
jgi:Na+-transporting NADH:ubiquinone oxidoreductase subunit NqrE